MRKISKGLSCTLVVLSILVSSFFMGFESSANGVSAVREFFVGYPEPNADANSGYLCVVYRAPDYYYHLDTYMWNFTFRPDIDNHITDGAINMSLVCSNNVVTFSPVFEGDVEFFSWQLSQYTSSEMLKVHKFGDYDMNYKPYSADYSSLGNIVCYIYSGNVNKVQGFPWSTAPTIHWGGSVGASQIFDISNQLVTINNNLGGKLDTLVSRVNALISEVDNVEETLASIKNLVSEYYPKFETELQNIVDRLDTLIEQSVDDKNAADKFEEDSSAQSDKINDLNAENKVDKTDVDSASGSVDEYIDGESIASYGTLLSVFTNNEYILRMILIVLAIGLISYVLFGKR